MKKKWVTFTCKLAEVKDNLFTIQGSRFYFIPKNKDLLLVLKKWKPGTPLKVSAYKISEGSSFFSVGKVYIDKFSLIKYSTRKIVACEEKSRLIMEGNATKMKINGKIYRTEYLETKELI